MKRRQFTLKGLLVGVTMGSIWLVLASASETRAAVLGVLAIATGVAVLIVINIRQRMARRRSEVDV